MNIKYVKKNVDLLSKIKAIKDIRNLLTPQDEKLVIDKVNGLDSNIFGMQDKSVYYILSRMEYLKYLVLSNDILQREKAKELILEWIYQHQSIATEPNVRMIDMAIRIMNVFEALAYLYKDKLLSDNEMLLIGNSLMGQANYLKENYQGNDDTVEWIILCVLVSVLPYIEEHNEVYNWAMQKLDEKITGRVYFERLHTQDKMIDYIDTINYGLKAIYYNRFISLEVKEKIYKLIEGMLYQMPPNKELEAFGDSSRKDIRSIFTRASIIFEDELFKYEGLEEMDLDSLYTLGALKYQTYKELVVIKPTVLSYDNEESGVYVARSDYQEDGNYIRYSNGMLKSSDSHQDNLHISIYYKGRPICIDIGGNNENYLYQNRQSHNGIVVDDNTNKGRSLYNYSNHFDGVHYYEGSVVLANPLQLWTRKVVFIDLGIWMVVDEVKQDGDHTMTTYFHLEPGKHPLKGLQIDSINEVEVKEELCYIHDEEVNHNVLMFNNSFKDEVNQSITFLAKEYKVENVELLYDKVTAKKFVISDTEYYIVVIVHSDLSLNNVLEVDGERIVAKEVVIHSLDGIKDIYNLKEV